jgi:hypothetical protein
MATFIMTRWLLKKLQLQDWIGSARESLKDDGMPLFEDKRVARMRRDGI